MGTGVATNTIINTRKFKKKPIKANCKSCVNMSRNGCRFGWTTIKGKCTRYGKNTNLPKEEANAVREYNKQRMTDKKNIRYTTIENLSKVLEKELTLEQLCKIRKPTLLGNRKFAIRCIGNIDDPRIQIIYSDRSLTFKIIKK